MCGRTRRRVARDGNARPARQTPHDGASGVRKVIGPLGRSLAESPGEKRPEKESEVIVVYRWVLAVCPMGLKLGRRSEFRCLGLLGLASEAKGNQYTEYLRS